MPHEICNGSFTRMINIVLLLNVENLGKSIPIQKSFCANGTLLMEIVVLGVMSDKSL